MDPYKYIDWSSFKQPLLTTQEVADLFRVEKHKVAKMLKCGELMGIKIGKNWVVPKEVVKAFLEEKFNCKEV